MLVANITNVMSILFLIRLFKSEGSKYFELFHFNKTTWKKDLLHFLTLTLMLIPLALAPGFILSKWFWNDVTIPVRILFQPIYNPVIYLLLVTFPLTMVFAELATYFGYIMPRLENEMKQKWLAVLFPVIFLSIQHCCLPLVFDGRFILYRGLMYFPLALLIGIVLQKRPSLFPYFAILHGLMDMQAVVMLLLESNEN